MNTTEKILFSLVAIWFSLCAPLIVTLGVRSTSFDIVSTLLALSGIYLVNRWVRVTFKTDPRAAEYFNVPTNRETTESSTY